MKESNGDLFDPVTRSQ